MTDRPDSASPPPTAGQRVSQYEIREPLGAGGMGVVFLAQDRTLDRPVALKFLSGELQQDTRARRRFLREAKAAAALDHPYICKIYETGEADGRPFIAMEYVRGETLADRLAGEPLPLNAALRIATEVAEALETAHGEGLVHRDLKPSNIMLTVGGHVKVLDFGLAKRVTPVEGVEGADPDADAPTASELTEAGTVRGTVAYMSPEQVRGQTVDARSDIFAFGVVLYELLTGRHPFAKDTTLETAAAILNRAPAPLTHHRQDLPDLLENIVSKLLAKAPDDRYQLVHDVRTDLTLLGDLADRAQPPEGAASGAPRSAVQPPAVARPTPRPSTWRTRSVVASVSLAVLGLAALGVWWGTGSGGPGADGEVPSVAVLPLRNLSQDPMESDYLAEGITEAVTTKLVQVGLRVTPWETALRFRESGESAQEIARALNVDTVLLGTFQLAGERIRASLSLVEAETGLLSWAESFDEPYEDVFDVQTRIAEGVAASLKLELTGEAAMVLAIPASTSVDAYDAYLQGAHLLLDGDQESTEVAFQYFTRAVELDPGLADAHIGLGAVYHERYQNGWGGGVGNLERAEASFEAALELDLGSMRARRGLMQVYFSQGHSEAILLQGQEAGRLGRPDDIEMLLARADAYALSGLHALAIPILRRVIGIDPQNFSAFWLTWSLRNTGQFAETIETGDAFLTLFGDDEQVRLWTANAADGLGDDDLAREHHDHLTQPLMAPSTDPVGVTRAGIAGLLFAGAFYDRAGERDRAEAVWQRGVELVRLKLETDPDSVKMRLFLASFHGFLGEREAFHTEEALALAMAREFDVILYELVTLAAAHAVLGNTARAVELLREQVKRGLLRQLVILEWLSPELPDAPAFDQFREEYDALEERLRERYGPVE